MHVKDGIRIWLSSTGVGLNFLWAYELTRFSFWFSCTLLSFKYQIVLCPLETDHWIIYISFKNNSTYVLVFLSITVKLYILYQTMVFLFLFFFAIPKSCIMPKPGNGIPFYLLPLW